MTGPLGADPSTRAMVLSKGCTFVHNIYPRTTPFPAGMTAWIVIKDSTDTTVLDTWTAGTVGTAVVSWSIPSSQADAIPENARYELFVQYPTAPATTLPWTVGTVVRK